TDADSIVNDISRKDNPNWRTVSAAEAQNLANQGQFVVAGMTGDDLDQDHGHVAVVVKGQARKSPDGILYPAVASGSIGGASGRSTGDKTAGQIFPKDYRQDVKYYVYKKSNK